MPKIPMSLKVDKKIKEEAQQLAEEMGFSLSSLLNSLLRQFIRDKSVYLSLEKKYYPSKQLKKIIQEVEKDIKEGKNISPGFDNADNAIAYLRKA